MTTKTITLSNSTDKNVVDQDVAPWQAGRHGGPLRSSVRRQPPLVLSSLMAILMVRVINRGGEQSIIGIRGCPSSPSTNEPTRGEKLAAHPGWIAGLDREVDSRFYVSVLHAPSVESGQANVVLQTGHFTKQNNQKHGRNAFPDCITSTQKVC